MSTLPDQSGPVRLVPSEPQELQTQWSVDTRSQEGSWRRLAALLKYGAALTTICVVAGVVTIWVRFQSLDGIGVYAVTAAEPTEWFATGVSALLETLATGLFVSAVLVAVAMGWHRIARRRRAGSSRTVRLEAALRTLRSGVAGIRAHPWLGYPTPAAIFAALWLIGRALGLPLGVRIFAFLAMVVFLVAGFVHVLVAKALAARPPRWLKPAGWLTGAVILATLGLLSTTWRTLSMVLLLAVMVVFTIHVAARRPHYAEMRFWDVITSLRKPILVFFVAYIVVGAIAAEADKPGGLLYVTVTPASGKSFEAISVGQKHGRAAFLRLTPDLRVVRHGVVEFTPGALKTVDLNGPIFGPEDKRPFWKRLRDWAWTPVPVMDR